MEVEEVDFSVVILIMEEVDQAGVDSLTTIAITATIILLTAEEEAFSAIKTTATATIMAKMGFLIITIMVGITVIQTMAITLRILQCIKILPKV